ncbi:MAG: DUF4126 domain-containing protein, partial [Proteobacteria bacterium]|nr:DUF4126 domain-containing protein [Pseudomonadota bacterium]
VGGVAAAGSHAAKAGSRAIINTSPEPFSNIAASIFEDVLVIGGVLLALFKPVAFLFMLGLFALMVVWLLPKIWRGLNALYRRLQDLFGHPATATGAGQPAGIGPTPDPGPPAGRP